MSALFSSGREGFLDGSINWIADEVRVMLMKDSYTFDATDRFVSELSAMGNGRSWALAGKSAANGVADADPVSLVVLTAEACNGLVIYKHNASDSEARLICYIDSAGGLPCVPALGQTMEIVWDAGPDRIFRL